MTVRIGLNGHDPVLYLLSTLDILEASLAEIGETVQWVPYAPGPQAPWLLGNELDLVGCGQTPMLRAHHDGVDAVYVASSPDRPLQGALVVRAEGDIQRPADLAGRRIGYAPAAWSAQLVAGTLAQAGLNLSDVVAVPPRGDADLDALISGDLDAAVIMGPRLIQAEETGRIRALVPTDSAVSNRHIFTATRGFVQGSPQVLHVILASMQRACIWVRKNMSEAAGRRARETRYEADRWGGDHRTWLKMFERMPWDVVPIDDAFISQQDRHIELFAEAGILSGRARARDYFLPELIWAVRSAVDSAELTVEVG